MQLLISRLSSAKDRQIFIATHNNLISSRLDLRKVIMLSSTSERCVKLLNLDDDTAKFFMKASDHNVLEFILSEKVILVEGDAEYMLMSKIFEQTAQMKETGCSVVIIAVGGLPFKRYLALARLLSIKTAVIRDNDKNYNKNCIENYIEYNSDLIRVFADSDNDRYTFEISIYSDNEEICENLFSSSRRSLSVQDYMLENKTDAAFALLNSTAKLNIPEYIREAIEWIKK